MRESLLEATRRSMDVGRSPTFEDLKADFEATSTHQIDEQRDPPSIKQFRRIVKTKSHGRVDGVPVDLFSASAVVQVYDALGKTANKVKYAKMDPVEMISLAYKLVQKGRAKSRETAEDEAGESKVPPQFLSKQGKKKGKGRAVSRETSQAGAGVKNAMAQVVQGRGAPREPEGDVGVSRTQEQAKLKLLKKASGNQPEVYQVLNPSGGIEGYVEKMPDKGGMKYPWKAFGLDHAPRGRVRGMPGRGKHIGDFGNKNAAMKAVMKGKKEAKVTEDTRLSKGDQKVIRAFADKKKATSKKLDSDGTRLDGTWMGGRGIAEWKGGKIHTKDLGSRSAQTVQKALRKYAAKDDFAEIAPVIGALARAAGTAAAGAVAQKVIGKEAKKISAKQIAKNTLAMFTKKYGEFSRHNPRHIRTLALVQRDAYLDAVRKGYDYPAIPAIDAEVYKLTKGPSRYSSSTEASDSKIKKMAYTAAKIVQTIEKGQGKISPLSANREALEPLIRKEVEKGTPSIKIPQKVAREFLK